METVITQKIDGQDIIRGFGRLTIEPVETKKAVAAIMHLAPEMQAADAKRAEITEALQAASVKFAQLRTPLDMSARTSIHGGWLACLAQAKAFETELKALLPPVKAKYRELMLQHAVYFDPKAGEISRSNEEIEALKAKMGQGGYVNLEGVPVQDNRGAVHCTLAAGIWQIKRILTLGEKIPTTATRYESLDEIQLQEVTLQLEKNAASTMSAGERATAKTLALDTAVKAAAAFHLELEIQSDPEALAKSQTQYTTRVAEIEGVYDVPPNP